MKAQTGLWKMHALIVRLKTAKNTPKKGFIESLQKTAIQIRKQKKRIYVGTNDILKAVAATDKPYNVVKDHIEKGATVESNGAILLKNQETIPVDEENIQPTKYY